MVSSTPQVNAIEHFWSPFKLRFKKKLMENPLQKINQREFTQKVIEVGNSFTALETSNLLRSNHAYMH